MAGSRTPGPMRRIPEVHDLNDGTMIRAPSPQPGSIGTKAASIAAPSVPQVLHTRRKKAIKTNLQILRQGSRGPEVAKLQRQLNVRLKPSPQLAVDGDFGPLTHQAVLQYQKGIGIGVDGVVGKHTWYRLLKGEEAHVLPVSVPKTPPTSGADAKPKSPVAIQPSGGAFSGGGGHFRGHGASGSWDAPGTGSWGTEAATVWEWPLEDKFAEVLRLTKQKLPPDMQNEFAAILTPTNIAITAATLAVWAGSHFFGVGVAIDIALLLLGSFFIGWQIGKVAQDLADFLSITCGAVVPEDLDQAASHLASAIAVMTVAVFIALLGKVAGKAAGKLKKGGGAAEGKPPSPKPVEKPLPKPVEKPVTEPVLSTAQKSALAKFDKKAS